MTLISGKTGNAQIAGSDLLDVTGWNFTPTSNNPSYASSDTNGYKRRLGGVKDASGSVTVKWDDSASPYTQSGFDVGVLISFNLFTDGSQKYIVPGIIDSVGVTVDINDGEIVEMTIDFSSDGAWTNPQ